MATQVRQSNLFAAEDWKVVYEAFRKIDLQAYDFDTIRESMINHLRTTYPDNFNDWIGNQEFIFILDTLCFLGQNLAFRMDLNTRENFIDTAERRESVLRLAQMLSYSPRRNYPARGIVKVTQITTSQDVRDSNGNSLAGKTIRWDDPFNPDWYEQFILVMNANLVESNPFGDPVKRLSKNTIQTQMYRLNTVAFSSVAESFMATVNGQNMNFEIVNPDIDTDGTIVERHPEPQSNKFIIYRNDGNGFSSPDTGFFMLFKQGTLKFDDYTFGTAVENRVVDVDVVNINELDVWCQQISDTGVITKQWTKVPSTQNVMYNSVSQQVKEIYSVVTKDNDTISLRFPDSQSGTVPRGTFRFWYRVSNGEGYTIRTSDIQNKTVTLKTRGHNQTSYEESNLEIKFSLQYEVQNSQPQETLEQIRVRAPQTYYTSNRLITGEDYNIGPLRSGNLVKKAKAINRTYSGHSRFLDINDPTGKYQNTNVFADDGVIYRDSRNARSRASEILPSNKPNSAIIMNKLQPLLKYSGLYQLYTEQIGEWDNNFGASRQGFKINKSTATTKSAWQSNPNKTPFGTIGSLTNPSAIHEPHVGMLINIMNPKNKDEHKWVSILAYNAPDQYTQTTGEITLSDTVPSGWEIAEYYMGLRTEFDFIETNSLLREMTKNTDFGLWYHAGDRRWYVTNDVTTFDFDKEFDINTNYALVKVEYNGSSWDFVVRGVDYVFVGGNQVQFFFINKEKLSDISSGIAKLDSIKLLRSNYDPNHGGIGYDSDIKFVIDNAVKQIDGLIDPARVYIKSAARDVHDVPTNPGIYRSIVPSDSASEIELFWRIDDNNVEHLLTLPDDEFYVYDPSYVNTDPINANRDKSSYATTLNNTAPVGTIIWHKPSGVFIQQLTERVGNLTSTLSPTEMAKPEAERQVYLAANGFVEVSNYVMQKGRTGLHYQWKHYAQEDHRIDPAITNIHDMYVMTTEYYNQVDRWAKSRDQQSIPRPPTTAQLKYQFSEIEKIKAVSDTVVWNSGSFVPLFGTTARPEYQARIKIVRVPGSRFSDDEIRQRVIQLTNDYFAIDNWDFGESFYFTELATYIHQQLATDIASVVLVPKNAASKFGSLFQITCEPHELFISTAKVEDIEVVNTLTSYNMQIGN